jgi:murein DD-endopeptidase MepM/ murein hydrolase activator NlpD
MKHPYQDLLEAHRKHFFPVMGFPLSMANTLALDFTANNAELQALNLKDTAAFDRYVFDKILSDGKIAGAGGYFEPRVLYSRSEHFGGEEARSLHLGVDVWMPAGTPVYAPLDAVIHSFGDNQGFGNYGPTLILESRLEGKALYVLLGHLSRADLKNWSKGAKVKAGTQVGTLGPFPENGDWPPHVHVQLMSDMQGLEGDFFGVCAPSEEKKFRALVADPGPMLGTW